MCWRSMKVPRVQNALDTSIERKPCVVNDSGHTNWSELYMGRPDWVNTDCGLSQNNSFVERNKGDTGALLR